MYYQIFHHLEDIEVLDVNNERHIVCLHFVLCLILPATWKSLEECGTVIHCRRKKI